MGMIDGQGNIINFETSHLGANTRPIAYTQEQTLEQIGALLAESELSSIYKLQFAILENPDHNSLPIGSSVLLETPQWMFRRYPGKHTLEKGMIVQCNSRGYGVIVDCKHKIDPDYGWNIIEVKFCNREDTILEEPCKLRTIVKGKIVNDFYGAEFMEELNAAKDENEKRRLLSERRILDVQLPGGELVRLFMPNPAKIYKSTRPTFESVTKTVYTGHEKFGYINVLLNREELEELYNKKHQKIA